MSGVYGSKRIIFFDTETTGVGEEDRLLQLAIKERGVEEPLHYRIYKPPVPIPFGATRVHGITEEMAAQEPAFLESESYADVKTLFEDGSAIAVAHNIAFDNAMLAREGIVPSAAICTFKVARALDPKHFLGSYGLQELRSSLKIEVEAKAHDAMGDVLVLEQLFERLYTKIFSQMGNADATLAEMIAISERPALFTSFRFGKHIGKKIEQVLEEDRGYLEWLLAKKKENPANERDWIHTLEHYLQREQK